MKIFYLKNDFPHNEKVKIYNSYIEGKSKCQIKDAELLVCGGGDGTLLKTIKHYRHLGIPFWGYNAGTKGFLMNDVFPSDSEFDPITKTFFMIQCEIHYRKISNGEFQEFKETFQAFNDICIGGDMNSWIDFKVQEIDGILGNFKGGGIIFSTSQGSTGINKNNGGTILPLSSDLWSVTGDKTNRRIHYALNPRETIIEVKSRNPVSVWVDGANDIIENVFKVKLTKGDPVKITFGNYSKFKKIRRS